MGFYAAGTIVAFELLKPSWSRVSRLRRRNGLF
jgi:hypothetical protein